jgi:hypothetical protein
MPLPFVSRARYEAVLADRTAAQTAMRTTAHQLAEADAANRRLHDRNLDLGRRNSKLTEADPEYTAALEQRVNRLRTVGRRIAAAYAAEKQRADQLEAATPHSSREDIEAWERRAKAHTAWTPPTDEEERLLVNGGGVRPTHPATDLRRALERCQALEILLARAEHRKPVTS